MIYQPVDHVEGDAIFFVSALSAAEQDVGPIGEGALSWDFEESQMGFSAVPHRVLPLCPRTRAIQRVPIRPKFSRELVVVVRKDRKPPEHLTQFIDCILFGRT